MSGRSAVLLVAAASPCLGDPSGLPSLLVAGGMVFTALLILTMVVIPAVWSRCPARRRAAVAVLNVILSRRGPRP